MYENNHENELYFRWMNIQSPIHSPRNARERAYWLLRDKIIYMDLKPGEPVSDKQLAEQLEMSRTPVREALILLSAYNMVVLKPQSGTFIAPINSELVSIEQFSRITMEKEIIRYACTNRNDKLIQQYEENLNRFSYYENNDVPDRIRLMHDTDNEFHALAFRSAGRITSYLHMLSYMQHIERLRVLTLKMNAHKDITSDHRNIANAVIAGDTATALDHLERHLNVYQDTIKSAQQEYPEFFKLG